MAWYPSNIEKKNDASEISYSNTTSGLDASDVQTAIDKAAIRSDVAGVVKGEICQGIDNVYRYGKIIFVTGIAKFEGKATNTWLTFCTGLPKAAHTAYVSQPNEYGNAGAHSIMGISKNGTSIIGKCSTATNYYYFTLIYVTSE